MPVMSTFSPGCAPARGGGDTTASLSPADRRRGTRRSGLSVALRTIWLIAPRPRTLPAATVPPPRCYAGAAPAAQAVPVQEIRGCSCKQVRPSRRQARGGGTGSRGSVGAHERRAGTREPSAVRDDPGRSPLSWLPDHGHGLDADDEVRRAPRERGVGGELELGEARQHLLEEHAQLEPC